MLAYEDVEDVVRTEDVKDDLVDSGVDEEEDNDNTEVDIAVLLIPAMLVTLAKPANLDEKDMRVEL